MERSTETQDLAVLAAVLFEPEARVAAAVDRFAAVTTARRGSSLSANSAARGRSRLERTAQTLLAGSPARTGTEQGFGLLTPTERALLSCAHLLHWSYPRMAQAFDLRSPEDAERLLWSARLNWAAALSAQGEKIVYPAFAPPTGLACPETSRTRPWFQRFLDEEWRTSAERMFLEGHLAHCAGCAQSLKRAKEFFFALDQRIGALGFLEQAQPVQQALARVERLEASGGFARTMPLHLAIWHSLVGFSERWDVRIAVLALIFWIYWFG